MVMIDEKTLAEVVERLLRAAPGSRVIVFGSQARGQADPGSDLDLLVVEPHVENAYQEALRLDEVLRPLKVPVDVLVVSEEKFAYWRDTPNTIFYRALKEGRLYEPVA
jgi:predicted nucleotidyltransferase